MSIFIQDAQLERLAQRRFQSRLVAAIAEHDSNAEAELQTLEGRKELDRQCKRARSYGLRTELELARYVVTAWLLGANFDTRFPAMQQVLSTNMLQSPEKADAIEKIAIAVLHELTEGRR
jgi:hypothetical protein